MLKVLSVKRRSPMWRAGVRAGDNIVAFDGYEYQDQLDIAYYSAQSEFSLTYVNGRGKQRTVKVFKDEDEELGIDYPYEDFKIKACKNKCLFCFVEQCRKGMRPSLYVKDDDYRLSFTCGSYVTMSNVTEQDLERIERLKLSPLYISVHCYDKAVKTRLCANPKSAEVFEIMKRLAKSGIQFHTQIVMIEGVNSDEYLFETLEKLYELYPSVQTVAVVPVGLTGHREGLYPLKPVSKECAVRTLEYAEKMAIKCLKETGTRFVWCADEMYLLAGRQVPEAFYYESLVQIENGVGGVAVFLNEANEALKDVGKLNGGYTCVTGVAFAPILQKLADKLKVDYGVDIEVRPIRNKWFGESVTVAGLVTATDIIAELDNNRKYDRLIIPSTMLKEFEDVFLDDISLKQLQEKLKCETYISHGGDSFIKILEGKQ